MGFSTKKEDKMLCLSYTQKKMLTIIVSLLFPVFPPYSSNINRILITLTTALHQRTHLFVSCILLIKRYGETATQMIISPNVKECLAV